MRPFSRAVRRGCPNNPAILLAQNNTADEAVEHFNAAIRSRLDDSELRLNLARAYQLRGLSKEAGEQRGVRRTFAMCSPRPDLFVRR